MFSVITRMYKPFDDYEFSVVCPTNRLVGFLCVADLNTTAFIHAALKRSSRVDIQWQLEKESLQANTRRAYSADRDNQFSSPSRQLSIIRELNTIHLTPRQQHGPSRSASKPTSTTTKTDKLRTMCHRTSNQNECGHAEVVTTRCRGPWSNIVPRRCLPGFKLPVDKNTRGLCTSCAIREENERRKEEFKRTEKQFGQGVYARERTSTSKTVIWLTEPKGGLGTRRVVRICFNIGACSAAA